jgi:hypothetical protein
MVTSPNVQELLDRATQILPVSGEELVYKGIAAGVAERMMALRKAATQLQEQYGSFEALEQTIESQGVTPDDHTRYTDLLEWRAIHDELSELQHIFETL